MSEYVIVEEPGIRRFGLSGPGFRYEVRRDGRFVSVADTRRGARRAIKADKRRRAGGKHVVYREEA